jgi:hypothetical protein
MCIKTAPVGWPSTQSGRMSSSHNFLSYYCYFRKYFKSLCRKCGYGKFNHRYNVSRIHFRVLLGCGLQVFQELDYIALIW